MDPKIDEALDATKKCDNKYIGILNGSNMEGGAIRDIAKGLIAISNELHSYFKVKVIVLDTNIILNDLKFIVNRQTTSKLYKEADFEFTRLFITPSVAAEVVEKIPKFSKNTKVDQMEMYEAWEAYKRILTVFNPKDAPTVDRLRQLEKRDADDVPTAELIELIAPNLALSMDKDLKAFGYSQTGSWLGYVTNTSTIIENESIQIIITFCTSYVFVGLTEGLSWITKLLKKVPKHISSIILSSISISALLLLADARSRKWISNKFKSVLVKNNSHLEENLISLVKQIELYATKSNQASKYIESGKPKYESPMHLKQYIIQTLIRSHRPLSTIQLMESAISYGYNPRGANSVKYLREILSKDSMFIEDEKGLWSLNIQDINGFKVVAN